MFSQYLLPLLLLPLALAEDDCVTVEAEDPGQWQGLVQLGPFQEDVTNWNIMISFSSHLDWMESVMADVSGEERTWVLSSKGWDGYISAGESLGVRFVVGYSGTKVRGDRESHSHDVPLAGGHLRQLRHGGL